MNAHDDDNSYHYLHTGQRHSRSNYAAETLGIIIDRYQRSKGIHSHDRIFCCGVHVGYR